MKLILNKSINYHVSSDTVTEFEKIILSDPQIRSILPFNNNLSKIAFYQWRLFNRCGIKHNPLSLWNFITRKNPEKIQKYFTILMGFDVLKCLQCLPYFMLPFRKSIYMFDAWPSAHELIRQFVKYFGVEHIFISSSQATDRLKNTAGKSQFHWIPEGINPEEYKYYPYNIKDIDVLAFGRKYDKFHKKIKNTLESDRKVYLYSKSHDVLLFSSREKFIDGLARSKISICFPSSITHPQRSGDIQTMTIRYLQSMVSKCLIVGHAPDEMMTLFGYNPVIEIDMKDPVLQIREILNNYSDYINLIENNYTNVIQSHTWKHRWSTIIDILNR